ncbi:hypothetical protein B0T20DRAFT_111063 [Sordaria brevicollis]|uniref:Uncharacterized protein n=1 Tax=Sordaria brevicollis TaxID=83679 RepID=A0AAE0NRG8_SORBR|nr:hypothetical protein B0T20DRAFT_111063 [Sordaria brevicollis]
MRLNATSLPYARPPPVPVHGPRLRASCGLACHGRNLGMCMPRLLTMRNASVLEWLLRCIWLAVVINCPFDGSLTSTRAPVWSMWTLVRVLGGSCDRFVLEGRRFRPPMHQGSCRHRRRLACAGIRRSFQLQNLYKVKGSNYRHPMRPSASENCSVPLGLAWLGGRHSSKLSTQTETSTSYHQDINSLAPIARCPRISEPSSTPTKNPQHGQQTSMIATTSNNGIFCEPFKEEHVSNAKANQPVF